MPVSFGRCETLFDVQVITRSVDFRGFLQSRGAILSQDGNRRVDSLSSPGKSHSFHKTFSVFAFVPSHVAEMLLANLATTRKYSRT